MTFRYLPPEKLERARQKHYKSKLRSFKKYMIKQEHKKEAYYKMRENLNEVRMCNRVGSKTNCIRWSTNETKEHVLKKLEICMELKAWDHEFITEAIFKNGLTINVNYA